MIRNPLSNMQMDVFVWGGWGRMEAEREREREKERKKARERVRHGKKRSIRCNWPGYYPPLWA